MDGFDLSSVDIVIKHIVKLKKIIYEKSNT